jgi:hypothetical protein
MTPQTGLAAFTPQVLDEQNGLQVIGTTVETTLYAATIPGNTITPDPAGRRVHTSVQVHLSNADAAGHYFTLNIYFGNKKVGILSNVYLSGSGNLGVRIDSFFSTSVALGEQYTDAQTIAYEYAFDYGGPTGTTLQQYGALSAETLVDLAEANPSQPIVYSVKVVLPTGDGRTYALLGHGLMTQE